MSVVHGKNLVAKRDQLCVLSILQTGKDRILPHLFKISPSSKQSVLGPLKVVMETTEDLRVIKIIRTTEFPRFDVVDLQVDTVLLPHTTETTSEPVPLHRSQLRFSAELFI